MLHFLNQMRRFAKAMKQFDAATAKVKSALAELKLTYTLKLFAGGEEAKELFALLAKGPAAVVIR